MVHRKGTKVRAGSQNKLTQFMDSVKSFSDLAVLSVSRPARVKTIMHNPDLSDNAAKAYKSFAIQLVELLDTPTKMFIAAYKRRWKLNIMDYPNAEARFKATKPPERRMVWAPFENVEEEG